MSSDELPFPKGFTKAAKRNWVARFHQSVSAWFDNLFGFREESAEDRHAAFYESRRLDRARAARKLELLRNEPLGRQGMPWLKFQVLARIAERNRKRRLRKRAKADRKRILSFEPIPRETPIYRFWTNLL